MKAECKILSYECAYNQLILDINSRYWRLKPIAEKRDQPFGLFTPLRLGFYQIKENCHQYRGFFSGSGRSHGEKLNEFLKNIYATQDSRQEGCMVLFRWIKDALNSPGDRHFLYILAKTVISLSCGASTENHQRTVRLIPAKYPQLVRFEGEQAERMKQEIDKICKFSQKYICKYEGKPDPADLKRTREFGQALLFSQMRCMRGF